MQRHRSVVRPDDDTTAATQPRLTSFFKRSNNKTPDIDSLVEKLKEKLRAEEADAAYQEFLRQEEKRRQEAEEELDERAPEQRDAFQAIQQEKPVKRGRGRPVGSSNKSKREKHLKSTTVLRRRLSRQVLDDELVTVLQSRR